MNLDYRLGPCPTLHFTLSSWLLISSLIPSFSPKSVISLYNEIFVAGEFLIRQLFPCLLQRCLILLSIKKNHILWSSTCISFSVVTVAWHVHWYLWEEVHISFSHLSLPLSFVGLICAFYNQIKLCKWCLLIPDSNLTVCGTYYVIKTNLRHLAQLNSHRLLKCLPVMKFRDSRHVEYTWILLFTESMHCDEQTSWWLYKDNKNSDDDYDEQQPIWSPSVL